MGVQLDSALTLRPEASRQSIHVFRAFPLYPPTVGLSNLNSLQIECVDGLNIEYLPPNVALSLRVQLPGVQ